MDQQPQPLQSQRLGKVQDGDHSRGSKEITWYRQEHDCWKDLAFAIPRTRSGRRWTLLLSDWGKCPLSQRVQPLACHILCASFGTTSPLDMTWLLCTACEPVGLLSMACIAFCIWRNVKKPQGHGRWWMSSSSVRTDCWEKSTLRWSKLFYRVEAKTSLPCRAMRLFLHLKEFF